MSQTFESPVPLNVYGRPLKHCCSNPKTGFYRDGYCQTGPEDEGTHTTCVQVTADFLDFSRKQGNDLTTPHPEFLFSGLKPGDKWCLCASRWTEAYRAGCAPRLDLEATEQSMLEFVPLQVLEKFSLSEEPLGTVRAPTR